MALFFFNVFIIIFCKSLSNESFHRLEHDILWVLQVTECLTRFHIQPLYQKSSNSLFQNNERSIVFLTGSVSPQFCFDYSYCSPTSHYVSRSCDPLFHRSFGMLSFLFRKQGEISTMLSPFFRSTRHCNSYSWWKQEKNHEYIGVYSNSRLNETYQNWSEKFNYGEEQWQC